MYCFDWGVKGIFYQSRKVDFPWDFRREENIHALAKLKKRYHHIAFLLYSCRLDQNICGKFSLLFHN